MNQKLQPDSDFVGDNRPANQWNLPQFRPAENQSCLTPQNGNEQSNNNDGSDRELSNLPQYRPAN